MAEFVRKRKKLPQCVSNRSKDSFQRKKQFGARGTLNKVGDISNSAKVFSFDRVVNNSHRHRTALTIEPLQTGTC